MFEKAGIRDVLLYFIPGVFESFLIIQLFDTESLKIILKGTDSNVLLVALFGVSSFIVGHLFSSISIWFFYFVLRKSGLKKYPDPYLLKNSKLSKKFQEKIMVEAKRKLALTDYTNEDMQGSTYIFRFCINYVSINTDENSIGYATRLVNLSVFASAIFPAFIILSYFLIYLLPIQFIFKLLICMASSLLIFLYCFDLYYRRLAMWIQEIYYLFYTISIIEKGNQ